MSYSYSYSYYHCKSILFGVFVTVIICVVARPPENNAHSVEIPNKPDLVQIWKLTQLDSAMAAATNNQRRASSFSRKLFYNLTKSELHQTAPSIALASASASGLHIPVRVIYDAPVQRYAAKGGTSSTIVRRNSKQRKFSEPGADDSPKYGVANANADQNLIDDSESEPTTPLKLSKSSFAALPTKTAAAAAAAAAASLGSSSSIAVNEPLASERDNERPNDNNQMMSSSEDGGNEAPQHQPNLQNEKDNDGSVVAASASANSTATTPDPTNYTTKKIAEKYIAPILDKLKELTDQKDEPILTAAAWTATDGGAPSSFASSYANALLTSSTYLQDPSMASFPIATTLATELSPALLSSPQTQQQAQAQTQTLPPYYYYGFYAAPPGFGDSIHRQWGGSPFAQYFPIVIRDPYQSILNSFSDLLEYGPAADVCQRKRELRGYDSATMTKETPTYRTARSFDRRSKRNTHKKDNRGKHRYIAADDNDDNVKGKNPPKTKTPQAKHQHSLFGGGGGGGGGSNGNGNSDPYSNVRGTDIGPQISKLIVRRGGVAIAGAGGIATAGSGGTAIVGPGGTAFTTPASSGGVAMVGPGGKVVKVSDLTDVLYGRTSNANVAATGAGQSTLTTKNGQVFTTSDNTGGVALVNPGGGLFGVSDDDNLQPLVSQQPQQQQQQQRAEAERPNEVQLPAGARLLTTGPIIYYNPVYPAVSAPVR